MVELQALLEQSGHWSIMPSLYIATLAALSTVVSTGSLPLALFCLAARLFGAQIIWIDSISQIDGISSSGRLVRRFASLFLVQWPELAQRFPGTRYEGELV